MLTKTAEPVFGLSPPRFSFTLPVLYTLVPAASVASMSLSCGAVHADDVTEGRFLDEDSREQWVGSVRSQLRVLHTDDTATEALPCAPNE